MKKYTVTATDKRGNETVYFGVWAKNSLEAERSVQDICGTFHCNAEEENEEDWDCFEKA